jgi:hypothetical protein
MKKVWRVGIGFAIACAGVVAFGEDYGWQIHYPTANESFISDPVTKKADVTCNGIGAVEWQGTARVRDCGDEGTLQAKTIDCGDDLYWDTLFQGIPDG